MKSFIVFSALMFTVSSYAEDISTVLKFDNPSVDCKKVSTQNKPSVIFSKIEGLSITKYEQKSEHLADFQIGIAFGDCKDGSWVQRYGSVILTKAVIERSSNQDTKFALAATYEPVDLMNDGRDTEYTPHVKIGLNISVTKLLGRLTSSKNPKVEVRAKYWLIGSGVIVVKYVFTKTDSGEIAIKSSTN